MGSFNEWSGLEGCFVVSMFFLMRGWFGSLYFLIYPHGIFYEVEWFGRLFCCFQVVLMRGVFGSLFFCFFHGIF